MPREEESVDGSNDLPREIKMSGNVERHPEQNLPLRMRMGLAPAGHTEQRHLGCNNDVPARKHGKQTPNQTPNPVLDSDEVIGLGSATSWTLYTACLRN